MDERTPRLRHALVEAIAAAARLQQRAVAEQREVERWRQRARYADERGIPDLGGEARARAARHASMAQLLEQRAAEMRAEVDRLRSELEAPGVGGRPPPAPMDPLDARLRELEVERELEQLRAGRMGREARAPTPSALAGEIDPNATSGNRD